MNIFEYLGLPADHRASSNKVTQLVKHWSEVTDKNKFGKNFALQIKKDGVCSITIIKDGEVTIWSRTGKRFTNTERITAEIKSLELRDGVYFGEMLLPKSKASLEETSGMTNPNRVEPLDAARQKLVNELEMWFFDLISIESFIEGASQTSFTRRYSNLFERLYGKTGIRVFLCETVSAFNEEDIDEFFKDALGNNEEGIIIRDEFADWVAGHKGYRVMKKVKGVNYDLLCVGYEEGTGKYKGKIANLIFNWKGGKQVKAMLGKGWSHLMAKDMFDYASLGPDVCKQAPQGKIFEVYALEESSKGKLRLPKVGESRHDKDHSDV